MSVWIDWDKLIEDRCKLNNELRETLQQELNARLSSQTDMLADVEIEEFEIGQSTPIIQLHDIADILALVAERQSNDIQQSTDPLRQSMIIEEESHDDDDDDLSVSSSSSTAVGCNRVAKLLQSTAIVFSVQYGLLDEEHVHTGFRIKFGAALNLNYPTERFLQLPLQITIKNVRIDARIAISADKLEVQAKSDEELQRLIQYDIEIDIGDADNGGGKQLRNVHKVEMFIKEQVRLLLMDYLVAPNFVTLPFVELMKKRDLDSSLTMTSDVSFHGQQSTDSEDFLYDDNDVLLSNTLRQRNDYSAID
ncbi:hypothetical protein MP228_000926 [Amoeboaphelidium protococcarum]|nr:hypothetical protein MP228_000926 [Amoeboaphelidium protococcarum]